MLRGLKDGGNNDWKGIDMNEMEKGKHGPVVCDIWRATDGVYKWLGWDDRSHLLGYPEQCNTMYYHVMMNFEAQIRV